MVSRQYSIPSELKPKLVAKAKSLGISVGALVKTLVNEAMQKGNLDVAPRRRSFRLSISITAVQDAWLSTQAVRNGLKPKNIIQSILERAAAE